ncbi:MAG: DNA gyrase inhibitor YacG [Magnetovibrio sp.]|nr:DNA gyrase inhibitor YacG [Magnetovibrio sp.]
MSDEKVVKLKTAKNAENKGQSCPMCSKPVVEKYTPFCSKRCADLDLGKWLGDGYRIPTDEVPGFDDHFDEED